MSRPYISRTRIRDLARDTDERRDMAALAAAARRHDEADDADAAALARRIRGHTSPPTRNITTAAVRAAARHLARDSEVPS